MSERRVTFMPAWDKREEGKGVHGVEVRAILIDGDWAMELLILTTWVLPETREWWEQMGAKGLRPLPMLYAHRRNVRAGVAKGECLVFPEDVCHSIDLGYTAGDAPFLDLVTRGDEALWQALERWIVKLKEREAEAKP